MNSLFRLHFLSRPLLSFKIPSTAILLLLIAHCFITSQSLFTPLPTRNYSISQQMLDDPQITLSPESQHFILWESFGEQLRILTIDGNLQCQTQFQAYVVNVIWPSNHFPIIGFDSCNITILDPQTCTEIDNYDFCTITNNEEEFPISTSFFWQQDRAILTVSGVQGLYQIDMNSSKILKTFVFNDEQIYPQENFYSKNLSHLYAVTLNPPFRCGLAIWENGKETQTETVVRQIKFNRFEVAIGMSNLKFLNETVFWSMDGLEFESRIWTLNGSQKPTYRAIVDMGFVVFINDANLFDAAVIFDQVHDEVMEVTPINNEIVLQRLNLSELGFFYTPNYNNRLLFILNDEDQVYTYEYKDDELVPPQPKPDEPENDNDALRLGLIIGGSLLVVALIAGIAIFVIKRRKNKSKGEKLLNDNQDIQKNNNDEIQRRQSEVQTKERDIKKRQKDLQRRQRQIHWKQKQIQRRQRNLFQQEGFQRKNDQAQRYQIYSDPSFNQGFQKDKL